MYGYIYKTTYSKTGEFYIGQHTNDYIRKYGKIDPHYFGSGKIIRNIIKKHGSQVLTCEILEWCDSKKQLNEREIFYISAYKEKYGNLCYNVAAGGEGGDNLRYLTAEQKKEIKLREIQTKKNKPEQEKQALAEKIRNTLLNKSKEEKIKISKKHSQTWHSKSIEEKRQREIDRLNTRSNWTKEQRMANSKACRKAKERPVIITNGEVLLEFESALICSKILGWADCMAGMYIRMYDGVIKKKKSPYRGWNIYYK